MTAANELPPLTPPGGPPCQHRDLAHLECICGDDHRYCTNCAEIVTTPCPLEAS